jgi:hypothetical protein
MNAEMVFGFFNKSSWREEEEENDKWGIGIDSNLWRETLISSRDCSANSLEISWLWCNSMTKTRENWQSETLIGDRTPHF